MDEYIEREKAIQATCNICPLLHECIGDDCANRNLIRSIPAADVVEVRHGEWKAANSCVFPVFKCSLCGLSVATGKTHYCPNCGAKMGGEKV